MMCNTISLVSRLMWKRFRWKFIDIFEDVCSLRTCWFISRTLLHNAMWKFGTFFRATRYLSSFSILKIAVLRHIRLSKITRRLGSICITMPDFMKIGQNVAEIWRLNGFQNGGRPPSCILKIQIFKRSERWINLICIVVPNFVKVSKTVAEISRFLWFPRWPPPPSWFFKNLKF